MDKRFFVKKNSKYDVKSNNLLKKLNSELDITSLTNLKIYNIYDLFNITKDIYEQTKNLIFAYKNIDELQVSKPEYKKYIAYELLPLQFDNRANSVLELLQIYNKDNLDIKVRTGFFIGFNDNLNDIDLKKIKKYLINPIEQREKNLDKLIFDIHLENQKKQDIKNFINLSNSELKKFIEINSFALSIDQLIIIQKHYQQKKQNPSYNELMLFDIYWSDHCRHTTFNTIIENIQFDIKDENLKKEIKSTYEKFLVKHKKITKKKHFTLMDLSLLTTRILNKNKKLNDLEKSNEINAISIEVQINGEANYLVFKNETHNHPSELEPFSGASTCLGGAMRDIFAARAYCFAGIRLSGCGNILEKTSKTLKGKLPQSKIAYETAKGFSSYGNQVGLTTQYIDEFYHNSYNVKHLECGAVLGVVPKKWVNKLEPQVNDLIILVGAKTGIDGLGGASGSSKIQNNNSLKNSYNEVQKGDPIVARKLQRLYRTNFNFTKLIKRSNDFGAGGASVAIGEIAKGVDIFLEKFKTKYLNIRPEEILFSESQERMAMVIDPKDQNKFFQFVKNENLDCYIVGKVTNNNKIRAFYNDKLIIDVSQEFLNKGAFIAKCNVKIINDNKNIIFNEFDYFTDKNNLKNKIKKGLIEMFDSTIQTNSKLNTLGGEYLLTQSNCLISSIPSINTNKSDKNVIVTSGFNTSIAQKSAYHMGFYSVIEAISKMASKQIDYKNAKISLQEFFPKTQDETKWALPFSALLGLYKVIDYFSLPVVGGKDSMSGTYNEKDVIPTIITFLINTFDSNKKIITNELKKQNSNIFLLKNKLDKNNLFNLKTYKMNIKWFIEQKNILASEVISEKTLQFTLMHMAIGNKVSFELLKNNYEFMVGDIIFQSNDDWSKIKNKNVILIGKTYNKSDDLIKIDNQNYPIHRVIKDLKNDYENIYPFDSYKHNNTNYTNKFHLVETKNIQKLSSLDKNKCVILHPIFPGTNCEFDTIKKFSAFDNKKIVNDVFVFKNETKDELINSIDIFAKKISTSDIIMLNGGFSLADEPDGSAKYIACILQHEKIKSQIIQHLKNKKLILGICNGFQALINSGILPNLKYKITENSPILQSNLINKHISTIPYIKYLNVNSPWISENNVNKIFRMPISHGEGCFVSDIKDLENLIHNNQIASVYCNEIGDIISTNQINPNNSTMNIEGIISLDGLIFGKMGHSERIQNNLYQNVTNIVEDFLFENGVKYILGKNYPQKKDKK